MRIVIDMQGAQTESRFRGIGCYTLSFAQAVVRNRGQHEIILVLSGLFPETIEPIRAAFQDLLPQENIRVWYAPGPVAESQFGNESRRKIAELIREAFLAGLQPDIIHICSLFEGYVDDAVTSIGSFDNETPVSVVFYDLIPWLNPEQYLRSNLVYNNYYHRKIEYLKQASNCLAISEFARQELLQNFDYDSSVVVNISTAISENFKRLDIPTQIIRKLQQKFQLIRPFILYTGGADQRKNLPRLIQAYASLPISLRRSYQLLFAGKIPDRDIVNFLHIAKKTGLRAHELIFTGYVSDEELIQLYNLCVLYVFPSWHEGFGLPALEAMACGAPVIGANTSSLPEVIGLEEALFDPMDVFDIAAKIKQGLTDIDFQNRLKKHGQQRAKKFSWDKTAKRAIEAWDGFLKKNTKPLRELHNRLKPKLAFISPLPPERTGIADYSAELLPALAEFYDIEVVVAQEKVSDAWVNDNCQIRDANWLRQHADEFDRIVYQLGNSPFHAYMLGLIQDVPGTLVLHDFYISGLKEWLETVAEISNSWFQALYKSHGYSAIQERCCDAELAKRKYPVNIEEIQFANGVIVHSQYSKNLARFWYGKRFLENWAVIPLLRLPKVRSSKKSEMRNSLKLCDDDFIVCSFGFLDETKLNHRLLNCWFNSALAQNKKCYLIFVGENSASEYGQTLLSQIKSSNISKRIRITGFVPSELFQKYLTIADLAVQLRAHSRGETSGTVLDCMNYALPVIVNANGSMSELDKRAVWMLPDEFSDKELIHALETLWCEPRTRCILGKRGQKIIHERHAPSKCASLYVEAIERFHHYKNKTSVRSLLHAIAKENGAALTEIELLNLSRSIAASFPLLQPVKTLYLDITATYKNDLKTGIERVVRALLLALIKAAPSGYRVEPVYLDSFDDEWVYRHACCYTLGLLGCPEDVLEDEIAEPQCGDILLGLDLSVDFMQAYEVGLYSHYRNKGVAIYYLVHDLLPVKMPDVFPPLANKVFKRWLYAISSFDGAVGVTKTVAEDLALWQKEAGINWEKRRPFRLAWSHHGADVVSSFPSKGLPSNATKILRQFQVRPSFLVVGTIEPRKGYMQIIEAFTQLWATNVDINLVIVGKEGWQGLSDDIRRDIPQTMQLLCNHIELNQRLFWLDGISDEYLEKVYATCTCLIVASYGEGFGLPLIEAAQHKLSIIARDIPVFREVAGDYAYYFKGESSSNLAHAIRGWLNLYFENEHPKSDNMPWLTWKESAVNLFAILTE